VSGWVSVVVLDEKQREWARMQSVSLKYWLSFVIKMKRKRAKRSDGIHCCSDVMRSRTSVLKPESSVRRPVRSPFGRLRTRRAKIEECDVRKR
jgi:hypothetical protein